MDLWRWWPVYLVLSIAASILISLLFGIVAVFFVLLLWPPFSWWKAKGVRKRRVNRR